MEINKNTYLKMLSKVSSLPRHKRGFYLGEAFLEALGYDPMDFETVDRDYSIDGNQYEYAVTNEFVTLLVFVIKDSADADRRKLNIDRTTFGSRPVIAVGINGDKILVFSKKYNQSFKVDVTSDDWDSLRMLFNPKLDSGITSYFEQLEYTESLKLLSDFLDTGVPSSEIMELLGIDDKEQFLRVFKEYRASKVSDSLEESEMDIEEEEKTETVTREDDEDDLFEDSKDLSSEAEQEIYKGSNSFETSKDLSGDAEREVYKGSNSFETIPTVNKLAAKDPFSDPFEE